MNHKFAGQPLPIRFVRLGLWSLKVAYVDIPNAVPSFEVASRTSRIPHWLADGNPFDGYPWRERPNSLLPDYADLVVIGVGFGGSCVAYHWAREGNGSCVLLERDLPASGAAGRNAGFLTAAGGSYHGYYIFEPVRAYAKSIRPGLTDSELDDIATGYCALYMKALERSVVDIHATIEREGIECNLQVRGGLILSDSDDAPRVERALALGRTLSWPDWYRIDADAVQGLSGIHGPDFAGFQARTASWHPAKWVWGLVHAALDSSKVALFTGVEATSVTRDGDAYIVTTSRGTIRARNVVNATEAYTAGLFKDFLPNRDPDLLRPHKSQAVYAEGGAPSMQGGRAVCFPMSWCHPLGDELLLGSDNHRIPLKEASWNDPSRFVTMYSAAEVASRWADAQFLVTREWTGSVGQAPDKAPVVGEMMQPGVYMLGSFAGAGSAISFGAAQHIVRSILNTPSEDDLWPSDVFGIGRFADPAHYGDRFLGDRGT